MACWKVVPQICRQYARQSYQSRVFFNLNNHFLIIRQYLCFQHANQPNCTISKNLQVKAQSRIKQVRIIIVNSGKMGWQWFWKKGADQKSQRQQNQQQPAHHTNTYFKSYSSERSCVPDQEDQNYLICTEKINDGNNIHEKQERVPARQGFSYRKSFSSSFNRDDRNREVPQHYFTELPNHDLEKQLEALSKVFSMNPYFPFVASFFGQNFQFPKPQFQEDFRFSQPQNYKQTQKNPQNKENKYYFSHKYEKDTNIKDI